MTAYPIVSGMHYAPHDGKEPKSYTLRVYDPENDTYAEVRTTSHLLSLARYCCIPTGINAHRAIFLMWNNDDAYYLYAEKEDGTLDCTKCQDWRVLNTGLFFKSRGQWCLFDESYFIEYGLTGIRTYCESEGFEQVGNFNVFINLLGDIYADETVTIHGEYPETQMTEPLGYSNIEVLDLRTMPEYDIYPKNENGYITASQNGKSFFFDVMRCTLVGEDGESSTFYLSIIENIKKYSYVMVYSRPFYEVEDFKWYVDRFQEKTV